MKIEEFLPELYLEADGCPQAVALNALRNTLRTFCELSEVWQEDLDDISLLASTAEYDLDPPVDTEISHVSAVRYGEEPVTLTTELEKNARDSGWRIRTGTSVIEAIATPTIIRVIPIPTADDSTALTVTAALRPSLSAITCADVLQKWNEPIVAGALARLKKIPSKPWTDREAVTAYVMEFKRGVGDARSAALRGHARRSLTVKPRVFGR